MRVGLNLMVGQEVVLCHRMSDQKINILTFVGSGRSPLLLNVLLVGKLITLTLQIAFQQELQTLGIHIPPIAWIHLKTHVRFHHAINNGLQSNLTKR